MSWESQGGVVCIVSRLDDRGIVIRIQTGEDFPFVYSVHTDFGATLFSYSVSTEALCLGVKCLRLKNE